MGGPATTPDLTTTNIQQGSQYSKNPSIESDIERMKRGLSNISGHFSPNATGATSAGEQPINRPQVQSGAASSQAPGVLQLTSTSAGFASLGYNTGGSQPTIAAANAQASMSGVPYGADMTDYGTYAGHLGNNAGSHVSSSDSSLPSASIADAHNQPSRNVVAALSFGMHYPQSATTGLFPGMSAQNLNSTASSFAVPYPTSTPAASQQPARGTVNGSRDTSPTIPTQYNQAFGLVGPAAVYQAAAMTQQQAQQQMHQHQMASNAFASAQMSPYVSSGPLGAGPPNLANLAASPAAQAMSAMSSFSGTGGIPSSNTSMNGGNSGLSPLSPATAYTPNFASPLLSGNAFQQQAAALSAATSGLNMQSGMYGIGMSPTIANSPNLSMPGGGLGALGINYPVPSSPNMAQLSEMAAQAATTTPVIRTVYVGNLPGDASVDELLSQVRYGPIESVKILPDKSCAFISFLDPNVAAAFHSDAQLRKIHLHGQELRIGWGKPTVIPAAVMQAVQQHGATRNVYLGNLDDSFTEETLRDSLSRYGHIDQVKIVRDKNIGFVHFLSIANAIKVVTDLPKEEDWDKRRVNYGKDRCAYVPRNQHQQQQHNQMAAAMAAQAASQVMSPFHPMSPMLPLSPMISPASFATSFVDPQIQYGNRTIYLGNLHPDTTCEDICNTIRGGILQEIRLMPEKHIAFVSFVLAESALALHQAASVQGITIKNRRLKVGWGKPTGACPPGIAAIVAAGGSRNVYVGNIDDFETFTLDKIKSDLSEYGEIEQVNALPDKSCAFVNYTKISSAVKAIEALKQHDEYSRFKIAYGKDRVGNMARAPYQRRGPLHRGDQQGQSPHHHDMRSPIIALTPHSDDNNSVQFNDPGYNSTSPQIDQANSAR